MSSCNCHMTSGDSGDDDDDDLLDDDEPQLDTVMIQHNGAINRIRVCKECRSLAKVSPMRLLLLESNTVHITLGRTLGMGSTCATIITSIRCNH